MYLEGKEYTIDVPVEQLPSAQAQPNVPLDLLEARNAVAIAKAAGAEQYANASIMKAEDMLQRAEDYYQRKQGRTPIGTAARGATQMAEDARVLTLRKKEQEKRRSRAPCSGRRPSQSRSGRGSREERRGAGSSSSQRRRTTPGRSRTSSRPGRATTGRCSGPATASQAQAAAAQEQAEDAQRKMQDAQNQMAQAQAATQQAEQEKDEAVRQKEELRARLRAQLNQVLQTRDTARGLIVSMPDVLFDFNKYTLKPEAREKLAKISGIVLAYPDLKLHIEGHTDSIGSDEYNLELSEKRADAVRGYLISQGVKPDNVSATGLGKANPVADNSTAQGRQLNRRVEMVVSGDVIGTSPERRVRSLRNRDPPDHPCSKLKPRVPRGPTGSRGLARPSMPYD